MDNSFIDNQSKFNVRCEWGTDAIDYLYDTTDVFVIVDVLSFSTCVDVATSRGATILPYKFKDDTARTYAETNNAILAVRRTQPGLFSLSPQSMFNAEPGMRIVLPSPNGATLSIKCKGKTTLCGSLRNVSAIAGVAQQLGNVITIVPAGERWPNGNIRFALEDALGAGAIISQLAGNLSPEAIAMRDLWQKSKFNLSNILLECTSGNELINRNSHKDIDIAGQIDGSQNVPIMSDELMYFSY